MTATHLQAQMKVSLLKELDDKFSDRFQNIEGSFASLSSAITRRTNELLEAIRSLSNQRVYGSSDDTSSGVANPQNHHPNHAGIRRIEKMDSTASMAQIAQPLNSDLVTGARSVSIHHNRFENFNECLEELNQLKEIDGILEYHAKFEQISTKVTLPEEYLVSVYLAGLRNDTQLNVRMFQPQTIRQCLMIGSLYENAHPIKQSTHALPKEKIKESLSRPNNLVSKDDVVMTVALSVSTAEEIMGVGDNNVILLEEPEVHQSWNIIDDVNADVVCRDDRHGEVSSFPNETAHQESHILVQLKHKTLPKNSLFATRNELEMDNTKEEQFELLWPSLFLYVTGELVVMDGSKELSHQHEKNRHSEAAYASTFTRLEVHIQVWEPGGLLGEHGYWHRTDLVLQNPYAITNLTLVYHVWHCWKKKTPVVTSLLLVQHLHLYRTTTIFWLWLQQDTLILVSLFMLVPSELVVLFWHSGLFHVTSHHRQIIGKLISLQATGSSISFTIYQLKHYVFTSQVTHMLDVHMFCTISRLIQDLSQPIEHLNSNMWLPDDQQKLVLLHWPSKLSTALSLMSCRDNKDHQISLSLISSNSIKHAVLFMGELLAVSCLSHYQAMWAEFEILVELLLELFVEQTCGQVFVKRGDLIQ